MLGLPVRKACPSTYDHNNGANKGLIKARIAKLESLYNKRRDQEGKMKAFEQDLHHFEHLAKCFAKGSRDVKADTKAPEQKLISLRRKMEQIRKSQDEHLSELNRLRKGTEDEVDESNANGDVDKDDGQ